MTDQHTEHGTSTTLESSSHASHGLRFEKQELESFIADDTHAGQAIGQLLAVLFCVLLVLMVSATIWTSIHQKRSDDPYATTPTTESGSH